MLPRDRVAAALEFRPPDSAPVEYHASPAGFLEHGEELRTLWLEHPDDFGPPGRFRVPDVSPGARTWRDAWGVQWREELFGAGGIPIARPLADWKAWNDFQTPPVPATAGKDFEADRTRARRHRERYFLKSGWVSLFELMHALRSFEDTLVDIAEDTPEINRLADRLTEHHLAQIDYWLQRGVDAIQFGDDFGTQTHLMLSPAMWRRFFKPRYELMIRRIRKGGASVFFHCCGNARGLLEDIAALGVDAIWPQLSVYDLDWLARFCRETRIAIALHPDRGELMIRSSPGQVDRYVRELAETFDVGRGGAWFYVEVDRGFPFENIVALTKAVSSLRNGVDRA
ncbi:MAG TPA: uroporphyrinogen decarboxylase family protein [Bryobacteraceae bacterium]|nr:uroporphyrinogen decarboxylase family protein [Bryobacteraceae bacterium]